MRDVTATPPALFGEGEANVVKPPAAANGSGRPVEDYPLADFLDPVGYGWTEARYEARQALKSYSEGAHADY